jgi:hypothetical protein
VVILREMELATEQNIRLLDEVELTLASGVVASDSRSLGEWRGER